MKTYRSDHFTITLNKKGADEFTKVSYPIRYGNFSELKTVDYIYQFNLNGEIKHIQGRDRSWPHPSEWLKRTVAHDWVYYSAGSYDDIYDLFGEYYIPFLSYPSNTIMGTDVFANGAICRAISSWEKLAERIKRMDCKKLPEPLRDFLSLLMKTGPAKLKQRADLFHLILDARPTVLPPDARHVDYEVIPLIVADGCLYNCAFCRVKTGESFAPRTKENILNQIERLNVFYHQDLSNYNSIFLGQHDALYTGADIIEFAATKAYERFGFERSNLNGAKLFIFGSVDSMLGSQERLFETLNRLPFYTHINLGLESVDENTLKILKKPISTEAVRDSFARMLDINKKYGNVEVSANFIMGRQLPENHLSRMIDLLGNGLAHFYSKSAVYLSPLARGETKREIVPVFQEVKRSSRLPVYLYLIQRL